MREIIFRGKRVLGGAWVEGNLVTQGKQKFIDTFNNSANSGLYFSHHNFTLVIPSTVGQYSGLTDKNGKKIFEGDILLTTEDEYFDGEYKAEVIFSDGEFCAVGQQVFDPCDFEYCEVIGNVHDNPELLNS